MKKRIYEMMMILFAVRIGCGGSIYASETQYVQNHLENHSVVSSVKTKKESKWSKFWKSTSKSKLWCGIAFVAIGGGLAGYGLSPKETIRYEDRLVTTTVDKPSYVSIESRYNSVTYDYIGFIDAVRTTGKVVNTNNIAATNVVVKADYLGDGSGQCLISNVNPGSREDFDIYVDFTPNKSITWGNYYVSKAEFTSTTVQKIKISEEVPNSPALGYIGIGAAVTGLSFIASYGINFILSSDRAQNLDVEPILYADRDSNYQGMKLSYRF